MSYDDSIYKYFGTPFYIKTTPIDNGPRAWRSTLVEIFYDHHEKLGQYIRNYDSDISRTFRPFKLDDEWYCLYSEEYTATRVGRLGGVFEDWCGEEGSSNGFCPSEFFVPQYKKDSNSRYSSYLDSGYDSEEEFFTEEGHTLFDFGFLPYAFVSGCVWGDDSSLKLQYIDLSDIKNKKMKREQRFGYWELPNNLSSIRQNLTFLFDDRFNLNGMFSMCLDKSPPNNSFEKDFFSKD